MLARLLAWCLRPRSRRARPRKRLSLECLEDRNLFSVSPLAAAIPLAFNTQGVAQVSHLLSSPTEADLYRVTLHSGDTLEAGIAAQDAGRQAGAGFTFTFPGVNNQGMSGLS